MQQDSADCQVLVVGAGPTGLVLAAELLALGINVRVIDKGGGIVFETRALAIHARALEVLDMMGLADAFVARGQPVRFFDWYVDGKPLASLDMGASASRFPFMLNIPQHETERLLRDRVAQLGGCVEGLVQLVSLEQDQDLVIATVKDAFQETRRISAEYVVGCDGAHSRVRHELGFSFDGHAYDEDWLLADVQLDWKWSDNTVHALFRSHGGPMICFPMRDHVWRLVFPYTGDRGRRAPTLDEIQALVDERAPQPIRVHTPTWLANFRCQRRSTHEYRSGRVLLAGDAVHVHSPAGGQGMNTGMMDAHNLAWKLAAVVRADAPEHVLDTYAEERGPVASDVLRLTHSLVQVATVTHPFKRALRDAAIPIAARIPHLQRRAVRRLSQEYVGYRSSSLVCGGGAAKGMHAGDRIPDLSLTLPNGEITRMYEVLRSHRHVLLAARTESWDDDWPGVVKVAAPTCGKPCLVRPDGYIAAIGATAISNYARKVLAPSRIAAA